MAKQVLRKLYVFLLLPYMILSGCQNIDETKEIVTDFTSEFTAKYREMEIKGRLSTNRQGITNICIDYPETVSGINFNYKSSDMEIARESLICSADEAYIPQKSFPSILKSICDGIGNGRAELISKNEISCTYNLKTNTGNCILNTNTDGIITDAEIKNSEFSIEFNTTETAEN